MLTVRDLDFYKHVRTGGVDMTGDITLYPLAHADFANLPPTVLITAQCDPLSSDGEAYRDRIVAAGGRATWFEEPGLVHGYLRARHMVGRARTSFTRIVEAVSALGRGGPQPFTTSSAQPIGYGRASVKPRPRRLTLASATPP